ncbi:MAG: VOC family protein [Crocinitomicaceae bacterium]
MKRAINWFEIPVTNFDRAFKFYNTIMPDALSEVAMPGMRYGVFPYDTEKEMIGGGIVEMEGYTPGADGAVLYLNGGDDLSAQLAKVEAAGGKVIMPKTAIGDNGFMAMFLDTEGNRLAFHSMH